MAEHDYEINTKAEDELKSVMHHLEAQDDVMLAILHRLEGQDDMMLSIVRRLETQHGEMIAKMDGQTMKPALT